MKNKLTIQYLIVLVTGLTLFGIANAYADHVDNNIWIETADREYIIETSMGIDALNTITGNHGNKDDVCNLYNLPYQEQTIIRKLYTEITDDHTGDDNTIYERINNVGMLKSYAGCGDKSNERKALRAADTNNIATNSLHTYHHECFCAYWYGNTIQDKYTFTITDIPDRKYRELPNNYEREVKEAIQAGLDLWGDVNDITFTYTDNRLRANIVIQQDIPDPQRGDRYTIANGDLGCLLEDRQCTIQLFTDLNIDGAQRLLTSKEIEETIAHELGHNFGLPHNIEHDNIMSTLQDDSVRTYYETRGIKTPNIIDHTHDDIDDNTNSICDATLVTSNEVYQEMVTYPEWYKHRLVGFTGTVKNVYPNGYISIDNLSNLNNYYTVGVEGTDRKFREDASVIVFGYVTTSRPATVNIYVEAIYMLENFDLCDNIPTEDNTPRSTSTTDNYEDNLQVWTAKDKDKILQHETVTEFIKFMKDITANISISDRWEIFVEIGNIIFGTTVSQPINNITTSVTTILQSTGSSVPGCEKTNTCFMPTIATINVGDKVVWKNVDNAAHTVTSGVLADGGPDGIFDSGLFAPDSEFSHVFDTPGEYPYFCLVHPWSSGMVIVQ